MYDTLRSLSHVLDGCFVMAFIGFVYFCCVLVIIDTVLLVWKDRMIIDYILEWYDRRKKK